MNTKSRNAGASAGRLKKSMAASALSIALLGSATVTQEAIAFAQDASDTDNSAQTCDIAGNGNAGSDMDNDAANFDAEGLIGPKALELKSGPVLSAELYGTVDGTLNLDILADKLDSKMQSSRIENMISLATSLTGVPYVYGGTSPSGFDCSGFTQYVMRNSCGIELPRTAAAQSGLGTYIPMSQAQRGDLIFWGSGSGVYHTGIYLGDGTYIHAGTSSGRICIQSCEYFAPNFAKRIL